jgi:hypothetical protein
VTLVMAEPTAMSTPTDLAGSRRSTSSKLRERMMTTGPRDAVTGRESSSAGMAVLHQCEREIRGCRCAVLAVDCEHDDAENSDSQDSPPRGRVRQGKHDLNLPTNA